MFSFFISKKKMFLVVFFRFFEVFFGELFFVDNFIYCLVRLRFLIVDNDIFFGLFFL